MRDTSNKYTSILLLDPFLGGLITPITLPVIKFWVDQKLDPILFGYAVGAEALLILIFYALKAICDLIGHEFKHHDALEDAKAAGALMLAAGRKTGLAPATWLMKRVL